MYEDELERVKGKIRKLHHEGKLVNRQIIFFGVSENTRQMMEIVKEYSYKPSCIIDNERAKDGKYCYQTQVKSVSKLSKEEIEDGIYFIYSYFWKEMQSQLYQMGVSKERVHSFFLTDRTLDEQFERAEKGFEICEELKTEIGDYPIFVCPYTGTGDVYLIGTFWDEYLQRNCIENYIFLVVNKPCEMVTKIFDIKNVRKITQVESSYLMEYYKLCLKDSDLIILNDSWWELRANPLQRFRGCKGLYFTQIFRKFVFNLPEKSKPKQPKLKKEDERVSRIFEEAQIRPQNTVIIAPFSNTLFDLPLDFWKDIILELRKKGYDICTNCGSPTEEPIEGTKRLFFPLDIAPQIIQNAGYFIGVRSGFCDCISASKAKKIIIYDKNNRFFNCSAFEYFNLKDMQLCDDAIEIEYDYDYDKLKLDILSNL